MQPNDLVCRFIRYPKAWSEGTLSVEAFFRFSETGNDTHSLSVASRYLLRTELAAHECGCRSAAAANEQFARQVGRPPSATDGEAVFYVGFYDLRCGGIEEMDLRCYSAKVRWKPENGEDAHCQIELHPRAVNASKQDRKRDRRTARGLLADLLIGPKRHICACDLELSAELEAIEIPEAGSIPKDIDASSRAV